MCSRAITFPNKSENLQINQPCALELYPVFGFLKSPGDQVQVNFKYHEEIGVFCKNGRPGLEPAISRVVDERINH